MRFKAKVSYHDSLRMALRDLAEGITMYDLRKLISNMCLCRKKLLRDIVPSNVKHDHETAGGKIARGKDESNDGALTGCKSEAWLLVTIEAHTAQKLRSIKARRGIYTRGRRRAPKSWGTKSTSGWVSVARSNQLHVGILLRTRTFRFFTYCEWKCFCLPCFAQ